MTLSAILYQLRKHKTRSKKVKPHHNFAIELSSYDNGPSFVIILFHVLDRRRGKQGGSKWGRSPQDGS